MRFSFIIILFIGCLMPHKSCAQLFAEYSVGYGTFKMAEFKKLLAQEGVPASAKITDDFPGYITQDIRLGYTLDNQISFGLMGGYENTGGNKSLADYSGSYRERIRAKGYKLAPFIRYNIKSDNSRVIGGLEVAGGILFNRITYEGDLKLIEVSLVQKERMNLSGSNIFLYPSFIGGYQILPSLAIQGRIGYEWSLMKGTLWVDKQEVTPHADWSGVRVSLDLRITFGK